MESAYASAHTLVTVDEKFPLRCPGTAAESITLLAIPEFESRTADSQNRASNGGENCAEVLKYWPRWTTA
jgi:hypothetical protein